MTSVEKVLAADRDAHARDWEAVSDWARRRFDRDASIESLLFLIGLQSTGGAFERRLKKEAKQDLIMEGTFRVFEALGIYAHEDGTWVRRTQVPVLSADDQELLLQSGIIRYMHANFPELCSPTA